MKKVYAVVWNQFFLKPLRFLFIYLFVYLFIYLF